MRHIFKMFVLWGCLLLDPAMCQALYMPPFNATTSSWYATHIVLVAPVSSKPGQVTVLESWKGELPKGSKLWIPEFARYHDEWLTGSTGRRENFVELASFLTNPDSRLILFLRRMDYPWRIRQGRRHEWMPANRDDFRGFTEMEVSFTWLKNGGVYGLEQESNPGPYVEYQCFRSVDEAKKHVVRLVALRQQFDQAMQVQDLQRKAGLLRSLVQIKQPDRGRNPVPDLIWQTLHDVESPDITLCREVFHDFQEDESKLRLGKYGIRRLLEQETELSKKGTRYFVQSPLAILRHASSLWKTGDALPPPYKSLEEAWNHVNYALANSCDPVTKLQMMALTQRQELLQMAQDILNYISKTTEPPTYLKYVKLRAEKVIQELKPAVPANTAGAK